MATLSLSGDTACSSGPFWLTFHGPPFHVNEGRRAILEHSISLHSVLAVLSLASSRDVAHAPVSYRLSLFVLVLRQPFSVSHWLSSSSRDVCLTLTHSLDSLPRAGVHARVSRVPARASSPHGAARKTREEEPDTPPSDLSSDEETSPREGRHTPPLTPPWGRGQHQPAREGGRRRNRPHAAQARCRTLALALRHTARSAISYDLSPLRHHARLGGRLHRVREPLEANKPLERLGAHNLLLMLCYVM